MGNADPGPHGHVLIHILGQRVGDRQRAGFEQPAVLTAGSDAPEVPKTPEGWPIGENRPPFGLGDYLGFRHLALKRQAGQSPPSGRSPTL